MHSRRGFVGALAASAAAVALPGRVRAGDLPTVRIATLDWAPYVGPRLPGRGWLADLVSRAFAREGLAVEYSFLPWPRALDETLDGRHDAVMPMYVNRERTERYVLSAPLPAGRYGFFARRGAEPTWTGDLDEVRDLRLGNVQGYALPEGMNLRDFRIDMARNDLLNLSKLAAGRLDLAIIDHVVARYLLAEHADLRAQVVPLSPSLGPRPTAVGFAPGSPGSEPLVERLDAGMAAVIADGTALGVLDAWGLEDAIELGGRTW